MIFTIHFEDLRLVISFFSKRIFDNNNILSFTIFFLDSSELLFAIIIFIRIFIQFSIILSLFFRINTLIILALDFIWVYNYNEFLIEDVILKTSLGIVKYIKSLV